MFLLMLFKDREDTTCQNLGTFCECPFCYCRCNYIDPGKLLTFCCNCMSLFFLPILWFTFYFHFFFIHDVGYIICHPENSLVLLFHYLISTMAYFFKENVDVFLSVLWYPSPLGHHYEYLLTYSKPKFNLLSLKHIHR